MNTTSPDKARLLAWGFSGWMGYAAAAFAVALATVVRLALDPVLGTNYPFVTYFAAVAVVAWFGRTPWAVFALVIGGVLSFSLFAPHDASVWLGIGLYLMLAAVIVAMSHAMRHARSRAEQLLAEAVVRQDELRHSVTAEAEQRERLRTTLTSIGDAVITTDAAGCVTQLNPAAESLTGWTNAEAAGAPLARVFHIVNETTRQPVETPAERAMKEGFVVGLANHTVLIARDGTERPIDDSAAPIRGKGGEIVGSVLVFRDITDRKKLEAAEREAQARMAAMLESVTDGFVRYDRDWRLVYVNAEAERINRFQRADVLGRNLWDLFPALAGTRLETEFRRAMAERVTVEFENRYEPWGRWYALKAYPAPDGGLTTFIRDITEQKAQQQALAESEARYRAIGESIDFGVWVCDATGRNTYASESFLRMVGITQQQCSDFGWGEVLHPDDAAETIAAWKECVRTRGRWDRVHRFKGADGRWVSVLARGVPISDAAGVALGWAGINLDITHLAQTERELARLAQESERQRRLYETVLTNTPDFVYVFSLDHKVVYANDALLKMWGRGQDGAIGKTFLEIGYEPWHAEMHDREIDQVRATRQPIRGEVPFNGTLGRRQYDYIFVPVIGADGEVEAVAGTTRDITDRLQVEERLRASEDRQTFLVTLADTIRPLSDPAAVQAEASRVLGERLGANRVAYFEIRGDEYVIERDYTAGVRSLAGRYPVTAFGPALHAALLAGRTVIEADATEEPGRSPAERAAFAAIHVRGHVDLPLVKGGRFVAGMTVQASDRRDWTPQEIAVIEDTAERTWAAVERARAEAALRASEERFRTVFNTMDEGFCVIELEFDQAGRATDYRIEAMNAAFETHTGMHGLVGKSIRQAIPALEEFWYETYGRVASTGEPARFVHQAQAMEGRWFDVAAFRLGGDGSHKVAILFNDITARKQAEAERERLLSQLKDQDRRKDEFLATLAHELRNPLAPIRNGLQVIRMAGAEGTIEQARSMMERQLVQMTRLVDDLLDVSRVTTGKLELRKERLALRDVITAALETSLPVIEQQGHDLAVAVPDEPVFVDGDPIRLAQVVSNLLTNSAKYTQRGGRIRVTVAQDDAAAVVAVADDGIGIPKDMLDTVFGMFAQVDRTLEKTTGGLGIGLSLVKGLVEMHGGTIRAYSEGEGRGSEFTMRLPVATSMAGHAEPGDAAANGAEPAGPRRILIVDDNVDSADSLGQLLEMMGNEVRTAYDGAAGVEAARAFRPGVVLCDIGMPKVNGYDTARSIRAEAWGKHTVLVALTGRSQEDDLQKSADAGFDHHLVKPVDAAALMRLLAGLQPVAA